MLDGSKDPALFHQSVNTLHMTFGAVNAFLLLTSSLFVAFGVRAARERITHYAPVLFAGAFVCASGFVINKYFEYRGLLRAHHPPIENVFYTYYYVLTGIPLTHLLAGMCVLVYLHRASKRNEPPVRAIESGASFWHVVDLLWMVLFAPLYLVR
jgi:nitric oxide reductase NorE protein